MSEYLKIHQDNPQPRLVEQAVEIIRNDGLIIYPTDSSYALGCHVGDKRGMERMRQIRALDKHHNFTLVCRDLSEIASYAKIDNSAYRLLKSLPPGQQRQQLPYHALAGAGSSRKSGPAWHNRI